MMVKGSKMSVAVIPFCPTIVLNHFEPLAKIGAIIGLFPLLDIESLNSLTLLRRRFNIRLVLPVLFFVTAIIHLIAQVLRGTFYRGTYFYSTSVLCLVAIHQFCGIALWLHFVMKTGSLIEFLHFWLKYPLPLASNEEKLKKASSMGILIFVVLILTFGVFQVLGMVCSSKDNVDVSKLGSFICDVFFSVSIASIFFSYQIYFMLFTSYFLYAFAWCLKEQARQLERDLSTSVIHQITFGEIVTRTRQRCLFLYKTLREFEIFLSPGLTLCMAHSCLDMFLNVANVGVSFFSSNSWFFSLLRIVFTAVRFLPLVLLFWLADHMEVEVR